jgi:hypothetical protein
MIFEDADSSHLREGFNGTPYLKCILLVQRSTTIHTTKRWLQLPPSVEQTPAITTMDGLMHHADPRTGGWEVLVLLEKFGVK